MTALLSLDGVSRRFGGLNAVDRVSFDIAKGEIVGLIGPNGAGKTTLINLITGVHPATAGRVRFEGRDTTRMPPHHIARLGLARTFQVVQPFPKMSVMENVAAGALFCGHASTVHEARAIAREHLKFTGLADVAERPAATLTLAWRKRLELAKGLAMKPRLLMLDEVNAGLTPTEIAEALAIIRKIADAGVTIVVIEHLMKVVLSISHRLVVLHHGQLIAQGEPREIVSDKRVIEAYLGSKYAAANQGQSYPGQTHPGQTCPGQASPGEAP
jgi:branched-chain amino acid transport system ATP-binding protein